MHGVIPADVIATELHADLDDLRIEAADLPRRHQDAPGTGKARDPPGRAYTARNLVGGQEGDEVLGTVRSLIPVGNIG